jgi:acyl-CoA thioester hydrolase
MAIGDRFVVRVGARGYEADSNGHVAGSVVLQYGQHARWECLRAVGIDQAELLSQGIGPVSLEERIRFHHEIRPGEEVDISCVFVWGAGKSFRVEQEIRKTDGTLAAEITNIGGLLDLKGGRLLPDPGQIWRSAAKTPGLLSL